jgi:hypothetical protein
MSMTPAVTTQSVAQHRPASRNHIQPPTNQTMAINPYPLTPAPPYEAYLSLCRST